MEENLAIFKSRDELEKYSKKDLIDLVLKLQAHLRPENVSEQHVDGTIGSSEPNFVLSNCHTRHVLLKLFYLGWNYQGFGAQQQSDDSVEHHLFAALKRTCLIESLESSNYDWCETISRGASGFSQVVSIDLRSKFPEEEQMSDAAIANEIRYCDALNRELPDDIRVIAWQPLHNREYNAHLDCNERVYRYFFPRSNLNIDAMRRACGYLVGRHDFRNLSRTKAHRNEEAYIRELKDVQVCEATGSSGKNSPFDMHYVELIGERFLRHQIRTIMSILFLVGREDERPEITYDLLDIERNPRTPIFGLAADYPLILFDVEMKEYSKCTVPTGELIAETKNWIYDTDTLSRFIGNLQQQWTQFSIKGQMMLEMLHVLEDVYKNDSGGNQIQVHCDALHNGVPNKKALLSLNKRSTLKLDTLSVDGCEEPFDYLLLNDLVTLGQTCKRLNQVVGFILQEYYRGIFYDCKEDGVYVFFHEFIHNLELIEQPSFQYLCNSQPRLPRIRRMKIQDIELPPVIPDSVKTTFARLETLFLDNCLFDGDFHDLLALCPKLKRSIIEQYSNHGILIGNGNEWLDQQYPTLENFEVRTDMSMVEELKKFLESNQNIRKFVIDDEQIMSNLWTDADVRLDELELMLCSINDEFCHHLNTLYGRGFYKRLKLYVFRFNLSTPQYSINGLVNVDISSRLDEAIQLSLLPDLEEIYTENADQIPDFHALPTSLKKLEKLGMRKASSDDIFPFICQAVKIESILVYDLEDGLHFSTNTNIIELAALNMEREKLIGAQKVTIYVKEKIYVATKWALKETDFTLVKLKRIESKEWDY